MKTAIYIENGLMQFVLTAETEIDKKVVEQLESGQDLETFRGSFYDTHGGWKRQRHGYEQFSGFEERARDDSSLIFVMKPKPAAPVPDVAQKEAYDRGYQDGINFVATGEKP